MITKEQLTQIVINAAKDSPYVVEATPGGFEIKLNIVDSRWVLPLGIGKVQKYFVISANLDEAKHEATLNDTLFELEWVAGANGSLEPHIGAEIQVQQGEIHNMQFGVVIGTTDQDTPTPGVTTYSYSSDAAKSWLKKILDENGWKKKFGMQAKVGIAVAIAVTVLGAVVGILLLANGGNN